MSSLDQIREKTKISNGVNRLAVTTNHKANGTGWVVINTSVPDYERYCKETNTISLITPEHEIIQRCVVTKQAMQDIVFPENIESLGSLVTWICPEKTSVPIVIGTILATNEKNILTKPNSFQLQRGEDINHVLIEGSGDDGVIDIIAKGATKPSINVKVINEKLLALFDLYVQGILNIDVEDKITIRTDKEFSIKLDTTDEKGITQTANLSYKIGEGINFSDEFGNVINTKEKTINITTVNDGVINLFGKNNKGEYNLLGESTLNTLSNICDNIISIGNELKTFTALDSTNTPIKVTPIQINNIFQIQTNIKQIKAKLKNLKSKNFKNT